MNEIDPKELIDKLLMKKKAMPAELKKELEEEFEQLKEKSNRKKIY